LQNKEVNTVSDVVDLPKIVHFYRAALNAIADTV